MEIPKNSQDQRKLGTSITIENIQDNDLIFCKGRKIPHVNHVGIFYQGKVHHAQLHCGVTTDELNQFWEKYLIQEIRRI
jgi:cell wall-associated NlpC family hydrolase